MTEDSIYFLTDVILGGELFTVLKFNEKFDIDATRFYAGCVVLAFEHLHSMDIIFRDLKPENLLLSGPGDDSVVKMAVRIRTTEIIAALMVKILRWFDLVWCPHSRISGLQRCWTLPRTKFL